MSEYPIYETTPSPTWTQTYDEKHYRVPDLSGKQRDGHLHGRIHDGGNRDTSRFAELVNPVGDNIISDRDKHYISVDGEDIITNALTIGCWIKLHGGSDGTGPSAGIIHTHTDSDRCGLIINANGEMGDDDVSGNVGYVWGNSKKDEIQDSDDTIWNYPDFSFDVKLEKERWVWVVLILYPSGLSRLFVDNVYRGSYDEGHIRETKKLTNLEVGRFSGFIDNILVFSETLDYGNVDIGQEATSEVAYLYYTSRAFPTESIQETQPTPEPVYVEGVPFYYMMDDDYIEAANLYESTTQSKINSGMTERNALQTQTTEMINDQKFTISGGVNNGTRTLADNKFMTFKGALREL